MALQGRVGTVNSIRCVLVWVNLIQRYSGMDEATNKRPWLERWFERTFGDDAPTHLGSGWLSGPVSVFLGACGLGAVAVLDFPEWLSSEQFRAAYPVALVRALVALVIGLAFLSGCLNLLLRKKKTLGLTGLALAGLATVLAGAQVQIDARFDKPFDLGFDWFLLAIFFLALVFVPLERLFPRLREQGVFRFGWTTDAVYFLVSHVAVQVLTFLMLLPATVMASYLVSPAVREVVSGQPVGVQVLELMLIGDLAQYWIHRASHRVPGVWPFHAVHHSRRALDWLAGSRLHLVDVLLTRSMILVPIFLPGFAQGALYLWLVIVAFRAISNHVNLKFRLGAIEPVLVTPRFHHWHHAVAPVDTSFAVHSPWLDRAFGTYHMPDDAWPEALGIERHPVPEGFLPQLVYPFVRRSLGPLEKQEKARLGGDDGQGWPSAPLARLFMTCWPRERHHRGSRIRTVRCLALRPTGRCDSGNALQPAARVAGRTGNVCHALNSEAPAGDSAGASRSLQSARARPAGWR